jgi:hypothetical protein
MRRAREAARASHLEQLETRLAEIEGEAPELLEGVPMAGSTAPPSSAPSPTPRARTTPYARESVSRTVTGAETRRVTDHANASELAQLTQALRPGLRVQIERSKPHWCAGIVEPVGYIVRQGGVPELLSYIREEWGGSTYRLTVLQPNGTVAYESQVAISAPPRFEGREIYRASWGGEAEPVKRDTHAPVRNPEAADTFAMIERVVRIMGSLQEGKSTQLEALREQNQELIAALRDIRHTEAASAPAAPRQTLAEQLGELLEAHRAVERAGKVFGGSKRDPQPAEADDDDTMGAAVKEGMKHFVGNAMASMFTPPSAPPQPRAPAPARARGPENVQVPLQKLQIPMSGVAGQKTGT